MAINLKKISHNYSIIDHNKKVSRFQYYAKLQCKKNNIMCTYNLVKVAINLKKISHNYSIIDHNKKVSRFQYYAKLRYKKINMCTYNLGQNCWDIFVCIFQSS